MSILSFFVENISTVLLYFVIVFLSVFFAFKSQKKILVKTTDDNSGRTIYKSKIKFRKKYFFLSFFVLWFFSAFNFSGKDKTTYLEIFNNVNFLTLFTLDQEFGFQLLNLIVKMFIPNGYVMLFVISTVTLLLIYATLYFYRDKIKIEYSVLAYAALFYFQSFNLMRIYLAAAILLFGTRYLLKKRTAAYLLVILIAASMHYSALIMILPYCLFLIYRKSKLTTTAKMVILFVFACALIAGYIIMIPIIPKLNLISRYDYVFDSIQFNGFGFAQILYHGIILLMFAYCRRYLKKDAIADLGIVFTMVSFTLGMISYTTDVFGRILYLFLLPYVLFIPYMLRKIQTNQYCCNKRNMQGYYVGNRIGISRTGHISQLYAYCAAYKTIAFLFILYFLFRFVIYLNGYLYSDGINQFMFLWSIGS